jgi:peptidoglycan/xylan/chitin deacetylase (PgdA/CDA1 family)
MADRAARTTLKQRVKSALTSHDTWRRFGLSAIARPVYGGIGTILALHRVRPETESATLAFNRRLEITPAALDSMLESLRLDGRRFVSMDEARRLIADPDGGPRWVAITLDDGYRDNLVHALPVFEQHGMPFTVYVTTCFPDHTAVQWWYVLEEVLLGSTEITVTIDSTIETVRTATLEEKNTAFSKISPAIAFAGNPSLADQVESVLGQQAGDSTRHARENALSWDDVAHLAANPLATIGAHTSNHLSLAQLDEDKVRAEIGDSVQRLGDACGKRIEHFAYPYGGRIAANTREFEIVKSLSLGTAVTTREANIFSSHAAHLESLPRIGVTMEMLDPTAWLLDLWLSGLVPMHENHFRRLITA